MKKSPQKKQKKVSRIFLYALSTCGMCRRVKNLLKELGVKYDYVDVDLCDGDEREKMLDEMSKWDPGCPFPMLIVNDETCVIGDEPDEIREVLGK